MMFRFVIGSVLVAIVATSAIGQMNAASFEGPTKKIVEQTNDCFKAFDQKARTKKLSVYNYKTTIDGVCGEEIRVGRSLYSIQLEGSDNQSYLLEHFDANVRDARASSLPLTQCDKKRV